MARRVDTVNMAYHHGQLREALVDAALALARSDGPDAVVLRAVSREAGVSHNAGYRHFADRDALLRAVCERCMASLALLMEQRVRDAAVTGEPAADAWQRLVATGRAYVEFAVTEPGWFRTAFSVPSDLDLLGPGEGVGTGGLTPYELLGAALDGLVAAGEVTAEQRVRAEYGAWSAVHGLATLLVSGPLRVLPPDEREAALQVVVDLVARGLRSSAG